MVIRRWGVQQAIGANYVSGLDDGYLFRSSDVTSAVLTDGSFVTVTGAGGSFTLSRFSPDGTLLQAVTDFRPNGVGANIQLANPHVVALDNGSFALSYTYEYAANDLDVNFAVLTPNVVAGVPGFTQSNLLVADNDPANQLLGALIGIPGGFAITWTDTNVGSGDVQFRSFFNNGNAGLVGAAITANSNAVGTQSLSDITRLNNGSYVLTWKDSSNNSIVARLFGTSGTALTAEIPVLTTGTYVDASPTRVAALANGGFVVVWSTSSGGFPSSGNLTTWAQVFDGAGNKFGTQTVVATSASAFDARPDVIGLPSGNYMVAYAQGNSGTYNIAAKVMDVYGNVIEPETIVATGPSAGSQADPTLSLMKDGRVVVTFEDWSDASAQMIILDARDGNVIGTAGDDTLYGHNQVNDQIFGDNGNDALYGFAGDDLLDGGAGDDTLSGGAGNDYLTGSSGGDHLFGGSGADYLNGEDGFDFAHYNDSPVGLVVDLATPSNNSGDAAGDTFVSIEGLVGTAFNDLLRGDAVDNWIYGGDGADVLFGRDGADVLLGEGGVDYLYGENGNDQLYGGAGDDQLTGGAGADALIGDIGFDYARYDSAPAGVTADLANSANNTGEALGDTYSGIEGLVGSAFADSLLGDTAANWIYGGGGNDFIYGRDGSDVLLGNDGNDTLYGNGGNDALYGGAGNDNYVFGVGDGQDTFFDLQIGAGAGDTIWLATALGVSNFAGVLSHAVQVGGDVVVTFNGTTTITLAGVTIAALNSDDFVFY